MARKAVLREHVPRRLRADEGAVLRPNAGIALERSETNGELAALRPGTAEQARAADRAERFHGAVAGPENADQLLSVEETEAVARHATLRLSEGPGVLTTA